MNSVTGERYAVVIVTKCKVLSSRKSCGDATKVLVELDLIKNTVSVVPCTRFKRP